MGILLLTGYISEPILMKDERIRLHHPPSRLEGQEFRLPPSKSLLNRRLVLHALTHTVRPELPDDLPEDSEILSHMLWHHGPEWHAGSGGTTFRFLSSYLAIQGARGMVTGTEGLCRRPVGPLVDALRLLGADIEYGAVSGHPPLRLLGFPKQHTSTVTLDVTQSSQFLSALLLVAPSLPQGLEVRFSGDPVSRPYVDMTIRLLREHGVACEMDPGAIRVAPGALVPLPLTMEADWTAASYAYALLALYPAGSHLVLPDLRLSGYQGDEALAQIMERFGVETAEIPGGIRIERVRDRQPDFLELDLGDHPDIAQTLAVLCALRGIPALFHGLSTLAIKETDRTTALAIELGKGKATFHPDWTGNPGSWRLEGQWTPPQTVIGTWEDHRMAMAFSLAAVKGAVILEDRTVVRKSFPAYWKVLGALGFGIDAPA